MSVRIQFRKVGPDAWEVTIPMTLNTGATVSARAVSPHKANALAAAGSLAKQIADNPLISSLLPPGTGLLLNHAQDIGRAAQAGEHALRGAWDAIEHSSVKKAFGSVLSHLF